MISISFHVRWMSVEYRTITVVSIKLRERESDKEKNWMRDRGRNRETFKTEARDSIKTKII